MSIESVEKICDDWPITVSEIKKLLEVAKAAKEHTENPHDYTPRNLKIKLAELDAIKRALRRGNRGGG